MGPTFIDKSQPIEAIGLRLRDHTRTGVRAWTNSRRTLPWEGIALHGPHNGSGNTHWVLPDPL